MKALASDPAALGSVLWALLLGAFVGCSVGLLGLVVRLHRLKRTGPRQVCSVLLLSLLLRTAWLAWYYWAGTEGRDDAEHHRDPLVALEILSRLNLNLTFSAVSSLVTLWLRALSAEPLQKNRIKRLHFWYTVLLYAGSFTLELLGLVGGEALKDLTFVSTLWTSGMALGYLLAAIGFGLHLSRGQRRQLRGLDFYRFIHTYTRKLQHFTLVVAATYLLFLALFLVGMLGNGREGNGVTPQSLPLHESALLVELFLALLIIWGVKQPLGGPASSLAISSAAASSVKTGNGEEAEGKGATLVWSSPRKMKRQGGLDVDDDDASDALRAPLLAGEKPLTGQSTNGVARMVGGEGGR